MSPCPVCGRPLCRTALGDSTDHEQRATCYRIGYERARDDFANACEVGRKMEAEVQRLRGVLAHNNALELRRVIDAEKRPFTQEWVDKTHRAWVDARQQETWRAERAERALAAARDLLVRLSQWDHMDGAGDGPFWRREIAEALSAERGET